MSFLNGVSGFGGGVSGVAGGLASDEVGMLMRKSLLNSAPADSAAPALEVAPTVPASGAAPTPAAATPVATASVAAGPIKVPPDLLPIYEAASKRTGIPVAVLIAQGKQESNFNPNAVGAAGEIGLHQIKPSTAAKPGFGVAGIDPKTLTDPAVNINFAADYLKAMAGPRINFNDPATVDHALANYNGGGDKNYVRNVRQYMGGA